MMDEMLAFEAGRTAFRVGSVRRSCPFPAPYNPPRNDADIGLESACLGAFWLDGFEQEREGVEIA